MIKRSASRLQTGLAMCRLLPAYVLLGLLKHLLPLQTLTRWAWCRPEGPRDRQVELRLAGCVLRLSRLAGMADRDCLQRSLLLYHELSRAAAEPKLIVGFERKNGQIFGHAWVTVDGRPVIESESNLLEFSPALSFGSGGRLIAERATNRQSEVTG
jgi:hypothetical protein